MIHFTCDMCGKDLSSKESQRFIVKITAYAGHDCDHIGEADLDEDHMETVAELIRRGETQDHTEDPGRFKGFRYDLCCSCHRRFLEDPLNRDPLRLLNFSKN